MLALIPVLVIAGSSLAPRPWCSLVVAFVLVGASAAWIYGRRPAVGPVGQTLLEAATRETPLATSP